MAGQRTVQPFGGPPAHEARGAVDDVPARWWPRAAALAVDVAIAATIFVVVFLILATVLFLAGALLGIDALFEEEDYFIVPWPAFRIAAVLALLTALACAPITMLRMGGRTLGKRMTHLRVVQAGGGTVGWRRAVVRDGWVKPLILVLGLVTFLIVPLIDALWPLRQREHRAVHDLICGTRVLEERPAPAVAAQGGPPAAPSPPAA